MENKISPLIGSANTVAVPAATEVNNNLNKFLDYEQQVKASKGESFSFLPHDELMEKLESVGGPDTVRAMNIVMEYHEAKIDATLKEASENNPTSEADIKSARSAYYRIMYDINESFYFLDRLNAGLIERGEEVAKGISRCTPKEVSAKNVANLVERADESRAVLYSEAGWDNYSQQHEVIAESQGEVRHSAERGLRLEIVKSLLTSQMFFANAVLERAYVATALDSEAALVVRRLIKKPEFTSNLLNFDRPELAIESAREFSKGILPIPKNGGKKSKKNPDGVNQTSRRLRKELVDSNNQLTNYYAQSLEEVFERLIKMGMIKDQDSPSVESAEKLGDANSPEETANELIVSHDAEVEVVKTVAPTEVSGHQPKFQKIRPEVVARAGINEATRQRIKSSIAKSERRERQRKLEDKKGLPSEAKLAQILKKHNKPKLMLYEGKVYPEACPAKPKIGELIIEHGPDNSQYADVSKALAEGLEVFRETGEGVSTPRVLNTRGRYEASGHKIIVDDKRCEFVDMLEDYFAVNAMTEEKRDDGQLENNWLCVNIDEIAYIIVENVSLDGGATYVFRTDVCGHNVDELKAVIAKSKTDAQELPGVRRLVHRYGRGSKDFNADKHLTRLFGKIDELRALPKLSD